MTLIVVDRLSVTADTYSTLSTTGEVKEDVVKIRPLDVYCGRGVVAMTGHYELFEAFLDYVKDRSAEASMSVDEDDLVIFWKSFNKKVNPVWMDDVHHFTLIIPREQGVTTIRFIGHDPAPLVREHVFTDTITTYAFGNAYSGPKTSENAWYTWFQDAVEEERLPGPNVHRVFFSDPINLVSTTVAMKTEGAKERRKGRLNRLLGRRG